MPNPFDEAFSASLEDLARYIRERGFSLNDYTFSNSFSVDWSVTTRAPIKKKTVQEKVKELWERSAYFKTLPIKVSKQQILNNKKRKPYYRCNERW